MRKPSKTRITFGLDWAPAVLTCLCCIWLAAFSFSWIAQAKTTEQASQLIVRVEAPATDVIQAVKEVTQDQIIHGTYSYEKERILYGAKSANNASVFGARPGQGTVFYKTADKVLSPRYFKDSEDIGTITVRYVVQPADATATILQIDAIFVDARNVHHPSLGNVESSEYAAIQEHLRSLQSRRIEAEQRTTPPPSQATLPSQPATSIGGPTTPVRAAEESASVPEMQKKVEDLRHQVELRVTEQGAQLKSAPFHGAATLESVPAESEVVVVIVSPYWYGVETEDGHRGWIHHSQLEPLP